MALRKKERLAECVKAEVSRIILFELTDPRIGFVTVTEVGVSGDLKSAVVKLSVLGDERERAVTMSAIKHARGHIQKLLCGRVQTKFIPQIKFEEDDSIRKSISLSKALRDIAEK